MITKEEQIAAVINKKIRPRTRVDGGDILFEKLEGDTVFIGAYADCATCPSCEAELGGWIARELKKQLQVEVEVKISKHVPYYA